MGYGMMHENVNTQWVSLPVGAHPMEMYVATPKGEGPWPGVIVLMEIFGVNAHIRSVTERLATEGYVAVAPNYYHRTTANLELGYTETDVSAGRQHKDQTSVENLVADMRAIIDYLNNRPDVSPKNAFGTMGFCFGGHVAYLAAMLPEVKATASFYGGGIATATPGGGAPTVSRTDQIQGEILCLFGENDPLIPMADVQAIEAALKAAGTAHTVVVYPGADHGFFCDARDTYDPEAAKDAWRRVTELFKRCL